MMFYQQGCAVHCQNSATIWRWRKRYLTVGMMAERTGLAISTYARIEKGDPAVGMGAYAMALFVLGFGEALGNLTDARRDEEGLLLDEERLPKRVRIKKSPMPL
jgi:hypothetical protein